MTIFFTRQRVPRHLRLHAALRAACHTRVVLTGAVLALAGAATAAGTTAAASTAAAAVTPAAVSGTHHYRLTDLGTLGGRLSGAEGINQWGDVVGWSTTPKGLQHAFLWRRGKMIDLGTLGGNSSAAVALNNRDQVIGVSDLPDNRTVHGFLWQRGKMIDLGTLGGYSEARAINERGQIVGNSLSAHGERGFLWQRGKMTSLNVATANGINNAGEIVGGTVFGPTFNAYVLRHGKLTDLGHLSSNFTYSEAYFINQRGEIAGDSASPDNYAIAVVWLRGRLISLGTLNGFPSSQVTGINDRGQVVGHNSGNFLWQQGQLIELSSRGIPGSASVHGINNAGELAGTIRLSSSKLHAALWR